MKDLYTPYVRPDGIIVGIKGKAPERYKPEGYYLDIDPYDKYSYSNAVEEYNEALTAFIQSGHPFEDQENTRLLMNIIHSKGDPYFNYCKPNELLPPIELDVEKVANIQDPCTQCGSTTKEQSRGCSEITCYKGRPGFNRTVLRIAKEEVKPTEEATETQEISVKYISIKKQIEDIVFHHATGSINGLPSIPERNFESLQDDIFRAFHVTRH